MPHDDDHNTAHAAHCTYHLADVCDGLANNATTPAVWVFCVTHRGGYTAV